MIEAKTEQILVQNIGQKSYKAVWDLQKEMQQQRIKGEIDDTLILVEHDPVYTLEKMRTRIIYSKAEMNR